MSASDAVTAERARMEVDIACVGFGPAMGGFLTTLSRAAAETNAEGLPVLASQAMPGMPLQVLCYERADDIGFGVASARASPISIPRRSPWRRR